MALLAMLANLLVSNQLIMRPQFRTVKYEIASSENVSWLELNHKFIDFPSIKIKLQPRSFIIFKYSSNKDKKQLTYNK